jgi:peptidyl-prolyl cis-trans isomerase SurA
MKLVRTVRLVTIGLLAVATLAAAGQRRVLEGILIRVNDRIVTLSDFRDRLQMELSQRPSPPEGEELKKFVRALFDAVLDEQIMLERADEKRITVEDKDVDRAIQGLREQNNLTDDAAFEKALAEAGLTEERLRQRYRQSILLQRVAQSEVGSIEITAQEVRQEYEKNRERFKTPAKVELEQLFFPVSEDGKDREAVLARVRGLVERVRKGADLKAEATLAGVELSDLGQIPVKDLRPELAEALSGLQEGELTDPLSTSGGFQVLRLVRRVPEGYRPFEEVQEMLRRQLSQQRYQEQTRGLVDRLKKEYLVETRPELLDQIVPGASSVS